jgi:hypothetical protein
MPIPDGVGALGRLPGDAFAAFRIYLRLRPHRPRASAVSSVQSTDAMALQTTLVFCSFNPATLMRPELTM